MRYTHPDLPGFLSPAPFTLGEGEDAISYARGWWAKTTAQKIASLGFVEYVPPEPEPVPPTSDDVDMERNRRIAAGFTYQGVHYQSAETDRENIMGAATAALGAMMAGAQPGNLRWHGGTSDFVWIAADNSEHAMDAQTMFDFGQAAMAHKSAHIFAARTLKDMSPIPADFAADSYWPA